MRTIKLALFSAIFMVASVQAKTNLHHHKPAAHSAHAKGRHYAHWDPGHTYSNPYGLPPWLRKPTVSH